MIQNLVPRWPAPRPQLNPYTYAYLTVCLNEWHVFSFL